MIYIVKHKDYDCPTPEGYKILEVGPLFKDFDSDNINHLNPYINELTGLYWIWKNTDDEYVGLCHYRRYFIDGDKLLTFDRAKELLEGHDILTTVPVTFPRSLYDAIKLDLGWQPEYRIYEDLFFKIPGFEEYLKGTSIVNPRNMFFCRKDLIDKYCEWMFPIVIPIAEKFKRESRIKEPYYARMVGFFAERLMSYWILKYDFVELDYRGI